MRIIVAGGSGFIGRPLVAGLAHDGHEVIVLTRRPEGAAELPSGASAVGWDGRTVTGWGGLVDGAGAVINLAGAGLADARWTDGRRRKLVESRTQPTEAVVEAIAAASHRPAVLLQASAIGYYGFRGDAIITEATDQGQGFLPELCAAWERASEPVEAAGVRRVLLRTGGMVLGLGGGALPKMALPFKLFAGGPIGSGRQYASWIHEDDEIGAIRFLLEDQGAAGPYNLAAPQPVTNAQLGKALAQALHRPYWLPAPSFALRLLLGELADVLLESARVVPERLLAAGYRHRFPRLDAALADLYGR